MRSPILLAAVATFAAVVSAHGSPGLPRIVGLDVRDLKARSLLYNLKARAAEAAHSNSKQKRQGNTDGQCGGSFGSCAAGYCCSDSGWCGNTADYCYSPGCQYQYGPGCNENKTPAGTNTSTVARTKVGSVPYGGAGIYSCVTPGTVAITYDDGPLQDYTDHILDLFKSYGGKATFFITGANINKGIIDVTPAHIATIKRMYADGHQLASHTWTHLDLSAISALDRKNQMYKLEMAMRNIVGVFPTYMRPPYSSCTAASGCEQAMANLGYHVTYFDVDTDDYDQDSPSKIQNSKDWFKGNITANGATASNNQWLAIGHDIHQQTAYNLTEYALQTLGQLGYKAVTVGECLGDPAANWYRASAGSSTQNSSSAVSSVSSTSSASSRSSASAVSSTSSASSKSSASTVSSKSSASTATSVSSTKTSSAPSSTATKVSTDATCGGTTGFTCKGSAFGSCCSVNGWCGSTDAYCGTGCQSGFGTCGSSANPSSSTSAATPTASLKVSTDASCAGNTGFTCQGSAFGNCCSEHGWCGSTSDYCGTGCNKSFGTCT